MVAVDDAGKPAKVPPLSPVGTDECRRFASAKLRRELRQELEQRFQQIRQPEAC
jgi:acyl-CoA hydrolase